MCLLFVAGSGGPASRARCGAPHLFLWPLCLSALLGPLRAGVAPLSLAALAVPRCLGAVLWLFFSASGCLALHALAPRLCLLLGRWLLLGGFSPHLLPFCVSLFSSLLLGALVLFFFFFFPLFPCAPPLSPAFSGFRPRVPWASALCVVCSVGLPPLGSPCACPSFVLSAWLVVAPRRLLPPPPLFVSRFSSPPLGAVCRVLCCAVRPWVRCCVALLRVVFSGVVPFCALLCSLGAAVCCAVPSGAARCPGALGPLRFAVFPRAVCVLSWRGDEELGPRSRLREYVDSKRRLVAKRLCYAKPTRSSWPLKQGRKGDLSQLKEDLKQKITTWQGEVDLKLMKSVWGANVRTPEEDDLSEECVCAPPRACLCCHRQPEIVERDLLFTYQGMKDSTKGEESVEDHLPTSITQGASNLHSDEDMEDKIKLLDPRVQTLIRTYLEVFGELPPPASCDKLVQMDLKLKPEFVGHKIRRRPYPAPKEQADEIEPQIQECIDTGLVLEYKDGDYPQHCSPCFLVAKPGSTAKRLVVDYGELD